MCKRKNKVKDPNKKPLRQEFKEFITKGNILDLAIGVVIGGSFNAIVTALVNILMSLCTFWVPGGIDGLVFALPAVKASQEGLAGVGQYFSVNSDMSVLFQQYTAAGGTLATNEAEFSDLIAKNYNNIGGTYFAKGAALVNVGAFINAIINFVLIAVTLFVIVKVTKDLAARRAAIKAKIQAQIDAKKGSEEEAEAAAE